MADQAERNPYSKKAEPAHGSGLRLMGDKGLEPLTSWV